MVDILEIVESIYLFSEKLSITKRMENLSEENNIKKEPSHFILSDEKKISTEMQMNTVLKEKDYLPPTEIYIKTEHHEDETEFPALAESANDMSTDHDMKIEMDDPIVQIECEVLLDEVQEDSQSLSSKSKVAVECNSPLFTKSHEKKKTRMRKCKEKNKNNTTWYQLPESPANEVSKNEKQSPKKTKQPSIQTHTCQVCNKIFKYKYNFDIHLRIHTGIRPFMCTLCGKSFNKKCILDTHLLTHSGLKPYKCEVCNKCFGDKSHLYSHRLIHNSEKPYACNECNKKFVKRIYLLNHQRIHTGNKPHTCDICNKSFIEKSTLTRHIRVHTGEKPYSCEICHRSFSQKCTLNTHKTIHNK